jgi:hypothetical protein
MLMPFHFCSDELFMILAMLPFVGVFFKRIHNWWHAKFGHKCHEASCHVDACLTQAHILPSDTDFICTVDKIWDAANYDKDLYDLISKEDLEERLGPIAEQLIQKLEFDLDAYLNKNDFRWWINGYGRVRATFHGRTFLHDEFSVNNTWSEIIQ